jgi:hypothetical protein
VGHHGTGRERALVRTLGGMKGAWVIKFLESVPVAFVELLEKKGRKLRGARRIASKL